MLLASPHQSLSVPVTDLLNEGTSRQLMAFLKLKLGKGPSTAEFMAATVAGAASGTAGNPVGSIVSVMKALGFIGKKQAHNFKLSRAFSLLQRFTVSRPVVTLTEKEKQVLRAIGQLTADNDYSPTEWVRFLALLVWNAGKGIVETDATAAQMPELTGILHDYLKTILPKDHDHVLAEAHAVAAGHARHGNRNHAVTNVLSNGARWMNADDVRTGQFYKMAKSNQSLMLGKLGNSGEVYFDGHESLITIGGPGSGKSQAHVMTNLLRSPGSAIVLDVKGELWDKTAGYREKRFGPVYRFAPTDPSGNTHRYNPLALIPHDPDGAADACNIFAYQVVAENPKLHDPYWENKGRDFVWAFAMMCALKLKGADRKVEALYEAISLPVDSDPDSDIMKMAASMVRNGQRFNIPDLVSAGNALSTGVKASENSARIESVLDTARRHLAGFARASYSRAALSESDWTPEVFRSKPGSTLYICMSPSELKANAAIVRLILSQHALKLQQTQVRPSDPPITFYLDEMPQLGNFEFITELQDVGRSSGLRLWMYAQTMGQLAKAFGNDRYKGIIDACRVRCFFQPDAEAAKFIAMPLGDIRDLYNGEKRPLATVSDLMGRAYADKIIVTTRGDHPMALDKVMAWNTYGNRMFKPPVIKRKSATP